MKKIIFVILALVFYLITNIQSDIEKEVIETSLTNPKINLDYDEFEVESGKRNAFVPIFQGYTYQDAVDFSKQFGINGEVIDNKIFYKIEDDFGYLCVYKNIKSLKYVKYEKSNKIYLEEKEIVNTSNIFLDKNQMNFYYNEIKTKIKDDFYYVYYIQKLDNMNKYSFVNYVKLDLKGNVLEFKFFDIKFERKENLEILDEELAYKRLLEEFKPIDNTKIYKCDLVYYYDKNIFAPYYLFVGKNEKNEDIEIFINAIK